MGRIFLLLYPQLLLFNCFDSAVGNNERGYTEAVSFLKDFIAHDTNIEFVIGYLCWEKDVEVELIKVLSLNGHRTVIYHDCTTENVIMESEHKSLFVIDLFCPFAQTCFELANQTKLFSFPFKWIVFYGLSQTENFIMDIIEKYIITLEILTDGEVLIANRTSEYFKLYYVYKLRNYLSEYIVDNFGYWNEKLGIIDHRSNKITSMRRLDLKGLPLTITIFITDPQTAEHLTDERDNKTDTIAKINYVLSEHLISFCNGTLVKKFLGLWDPSKNVSFKSLINDLYNNKADIAGTPMYLKEDRLIAADMVTITTPIDISFVFRSPPLSAVSNIFIMPFENGVWWTLIVFLIISCISLYITTLFQNRLYEKQTKKPCVLCGKKDSDTKISFGEICMITIGAVTQQGSVIEPKHFSGRLANFVIFFSVMFIYVSYSSNIVALLRSQSNNINTLNDMLDANMEFGVQDYPLIKLYFNSYNDSVRKAIQKKVNVANSPKYFSIEEGIKLMQKGLFAFHMEVGDGYKYVNEIFQENEKCGMKEILYLDPLVAYYSIKRNTSFREMFKIGIRRFHEVGLVSRENQRLYSKKPMCATNGLFSSVGIGDIKPAIYIMLIGFMTSLSVLIIELSMKMRLDCIERLKCLRRN